MEGLSEVEKENDERKFDICDSSVTRFLKTDLEPELHPMKRFVEPHQIRGW